MSERILTCPKCGWAASVAEDVSGYLDWGFAVIDEHGTVRPADPNQDPPVLSADNAAGAGRARACCSNSDCRHQWRLRRPFDPTPTP